MTLNRTAVMLAFLAIGCFAVPAAAQDAQDGQDGQNAQDAQDAQALMAQGVEARRAGEDARALTYFRRAQSLSPTARGTAQIALAEQALGQWSRAVEHFSEALAVTDPWIDDNRDALVAALRVIREHVGQLELVGGESGSDVLIDDDRVAELPLDAPLWVTAGTHELLVRADGFMPFRRHLTIAAGGVAREGIDQRPLGEEPLLAESGGESSAAPTPIGKSWWFWTIIGVAAVAVGVGIAFAVQDPGVQEPVAGDVGPGGVVVALGSGR